MPIADDLYYFEFEGGSGERPPVVLIHGAGGTHLHWSPEIRRLAGFRTYALDLPGHGKSAGRGHQTITAYTDAVRGWLRAVDLHRAVFVGHSMGSAIALDLALEHADQVIGLGLIGSGPSLPVNPDILQDLESETTFRSTVEKVTRWSFSPETPERMVELAAERMAESRPSVLLGDFKACDSFDVSDRLEEIHQPALVITGVDDKMTPVRFAQFLADKISAARLELVPGAGHMVMLEQVEATAHLLSDFLGGLKF